MTPELPKIIRSRNAAAKTLKLTTAVLNLAATMQVSLGTDGVYQALRV